MRKNKRKFCQWLQQLWDQGAGELKQCGKAGWAVKMALHLKPECDGHIFISTSQLHTWTKPDWFSRVWAATGLTSNCNSPHFWKPTAFIQVSKGHLSSGTEHPEFPFSYWKVQRLELHNNKYIHKVIRCLYCTIYFIVKTCLFIFHLKGFSVFSHLKHE